MSQRGAKHGSFSTPREVKVTRNLRYFVIADETKPGLRFTALVMWPNESTAYVS
jgi:hypothetical protein